MSRKQGVTRRTFLSNAAAAATLAGAPLHLLAQDAPVSPPEIATPGRPQGTDKFGPSVDNIPIIDAHVHLFDGRRTQGAGYMGSAAYRAQSQISLPGMYRRARAALRHRGRDHRRIQRQGRRQRLVPGSVGRRSVHGGCVWTPRSVQPRLRRESGALSEKPAVSRHPRKPLFTRTPTAK